MTQPEANFDPEAVALIRHLKAKGLVLVVFAAERGNGLSVQFTEDSAEVMKDVPTILRRLASKMERDLALKRISKG
jgi:hypothetical protein